MKLRLAGLALWLLTTSASSADRWLFEARLAVTAAPAAGIYHHFDGAGRKHIAVNDKAVAATWEDNRDGSPQVYAALKPLAAGAFSPAIRVSDGSEAYEPAVVSLDDGRFALSWEQDGAVWAGVVDASGIGPRLQLAAAPASHSSLAVHGNRLFTAWRERRDGAWYIRVGRLKVTDTGLLTLESSLPVEPGGIETPVQYPSLAANQAGVCIAWEDRRAGHTRLLVSGAENSAAGFAEPHDLNEYFSERNRYDKGSGVTRVVLASFGDDEVIAAWMDKRREGAGYGIFAALGSATGDIFGPNEKVHGGDGDRLPHSNPAAAGNLAGDFVVAWDDFRRGDADIWLSGYDEDLVWSTDHAPAPASGNGEQTSPSIALDAAGGLHLLWIERAEPNAPSQIWYSRGLPR